MKTIAMMLALCALAACSDSKPKRCSDGCASLDGGHDAMRTIDSGHDAATTDDASSDSATTMTDSATTMMSDASDDAGDGDRPHCKRGVAYGYHSVDDMRALSDGVWWWYNWAPRPDTDVRNDYASLGFEFVPMIWGGNFDDDRIDDELVSDARYLLGFNEPNFFAQANLSPSEAAALWPRVEAIADAHDLEIVSPAVNFCGPAQSCHDTDPFDYLDAFFAACSDCRVDYIAAHWYACDGPALTWYLGELKQYGKPIWLTEFSCGDGADRSLEKQKAYMEDALAILEADDDVFRYAWFAGRTTAIPNVDLLDESGELTELGELYVSLPHHDPRCSR